MPQPPTSGVAPPRIPPLELPDLTPSPAATLEPQDLREGERIVGRGITRLHAARSTIRGCELDLTEIGELVVDDGRLIDSRVVEPGIATVKSPAATWRQVAITGGRITALEADQARWDQVTMVGTRLGYLNLRDAQLTDVRLAECRIDTLDLSAATVTRLDLAGTQVAELLVYRATLTDADLRGTDLGDVDDPRALAGVALSPSQLLDLAPRLAQALGILVLDDAD